MKAAVITGDVIGSSRVPESKRKQLLALMEEALQKGSKFIPDYTAEIFQGDSFQGFTTTGISRSLQTAFYLICLFLQKDFGLRISVGIGDLSFETESSLTSDGPAFMRSGRNMELLRKNQWQIGVFVGIENVQSEWDVHNETLNYLLNNCTALQAEAMVQMLEGQTQQQAAANIGVKQPAIQQRLQAAGWPLIQTILHRFEMQF